MAAADPFILGRIPPPGASSPSGRRLTLPQDETGAIALSVGARKELRAWVVLAAGSLAIAGVLALLVALSRVPRVPAFLPWMTDFFSKGLVIHVVFSFVVWFLTAFAVLATLATHRLCAEERPWWRAIGGVARTLVAASFPLLLAPAFFRATEASLNNYIPAIDHPLYLAGLVCLFAGISLVVVRLWGHGLTARGSLDTLSLAAVAGSIVYVVALICFVLAWRDASRSSGAYAYYEHLFWGGGHVLQFLNVILLVAGWSWLYQYAAEPPSWWHVTMRIAIVMLTLSVLPGPLFYWMYPDNASRLSYAFTMIQYALGPPTLLAALAMGIAVARTPQASGPSLRTVASLCIVLSLVVFGIGGAFGLAVDGADTRTPAHYHGVIAGVNLALMGLFLLLILPAIGRAPDTTQRRLRWQVALFGVGQTIACIGLFWAGGYGAPRKVAGYSGTLVDGAIIGMYLNGFGAVIAIIGGVMFIWAVLAAALRPGPIATVRP